MWVPLLVWCSIGKNCTDIVLPECNSCGIPRSNRGTRIQDRSSHAAGYRISLSSSDSETGLSFMQPPLRVPERSRRISCQSILDYQPFAASRHNP